ncbi:CPBP family intramembrane metalloprotease [Enterococcus saccharolyticus]|uniref:CAAX protease n=1 Tax=Candidatus Enterococcus willemsii TaxID=1857215 RepID=A0ABQ6YX70_9ENTE|nr:MULTISPECIES: type II CAAX endopeptidase family protein [Enterococcus]KAF1302419.1 CAAX protease [Enterococcus sp. CU12B]MCD5002601.1 CPBP family intramembrane metalloprotease [Enterococcus saccharolyticus]
MSVKKYSVLTIGLYVLIFLSPLLFATFHAQAWGVIISYLLGAILMIAMYLKQTSFLSFEKKQPNWLLVILLGVLGIFGSIILQNIVIQIEVLFGQNPVSQNTEGIVQNVLAQPLFFIAVMIGAPIMEEFVFRRAITGLLEHYMNVWLAIAISSFLFALIHFDGHLLLYFSLGFFFSILYKTTGKIWTSILTHAGMNALVLIAQLVLTTS